MEQSLQYKQEGNQCFSQGKYKEAIIAYTNAIDSCPEDNKNDRAVFFKNRAACHLKLENYKVAVKDADQALELSPSDAKALYRKCQALENLGSHEEAYKESRKLIHLDPKNTAVQTMCRRLAALLTTKAEDQSKTVNRVSQMFNLLNTKDECDIEKKRQAAQNLIVLAREEAGAERIFRENGVPQILNLANDDDKETKLSALRALACICTGHKARSCAIVRDVGLDKLGKYIGTDDEDLASAGANILQQIIFSFIKEDTTEHKGKEQAVVADTDKEIKSILLFVMKLLTDKSISGYGRDAVLDILIKTLPNKHGKGKSLSFITNGGLNKLLHVACQVPDLKRLPITPNTRMRTSLLFEELYDSMLSDKNRAYYKELVNKFLTERFMHNVMESNMEAITAITALLQGPFDVGSEMIQRDGVMEIMVAMAASKDEKLQIVSTEAIIHTASKKKHCLGVLSAGVPILKELYKSKNVTERVRVRALVGLCKFGCYGGTDASIRAFAEGSNIRLASEIRRFLLNAQKDADIRKWAAEGLGYLTLDADVKEALCEDEEALKAVIQTAKTMDTSMYYGYASIFVNLTNSYYKDEPPKELVDLARFAKQHVPEEHLKDAPEYVVKRVKLLLKLGVVTSLVFMSNKTDSNAVKELLSRTFLALTENEKDRGLIIQQGGAKACILLANNGNEEGKTQAAQALAKIAITNNPEIAFPGQRCLEVVRPLIQLLHVEKTGLQNFESLMALTNLAQVSDSVRNRIVKEKGIPAIENYLFEDHDMIRRAAAECMCNLIVNEEVFESHLRENDKVKLLTVLCGMEDPDLVQACAGTLAILSHNEIACKKITALKSWLETLQQMCLSERTQIQHRALYITGNMIACDKDIAIKIIESKLLEILMVLSKEAKDETIKELALKALHEAAEMKLIKPVAH